VTITVDDCVITDIDAPTGTYDSEYLIFALTDLVVDLSTPGF
jgi:hypothetical protein